jgi:hypothetical protein
VAICGMLAVLAWVGGAAADTPQGQLTGSATLGPPASASFAITAPVIDGGTSFVGLENDTSGNCTGDSGTVFVGGILTATVACAHFVASSGCCSTGSPKMRLAYQLPAGSYVVVRITDNGASIDTFASTSAGTLAQAQACVNLGQRDGGCSPWAFSGVTGNYAVNASPP